MTTQIERPWPRFYGSVPANLDDPRLALYEAVRGRGRQRAAGAGGDGTIDFKELVAEHLKGPAA